MALVALVAVIQALDLVVRLPSDFPAYGRLGIVVTTAYVLGAGAVLVAAWRAAGRVTTRRWILSFVIVGLAIAIRAVIAVAFDAPLAGENRIIHEQALGVLDGANCCFSHRPMGYPLTLAGAYALLGIGPGAIEALNIACAGLTTWLVFDIGRVAWGRRVAALAASTFAIVPSQVLMGLPPLTEPLYTVAVVAVVRLAMSVPVRGLMIAALLGLAVAAAQYVRASAASLLGPLAMLPVLVGVGLRRAALMAAITVAAFVVAMLPVISYNLDTHGDISVSTSAYAGWSVFVGANQTHDGRWNADDAALFTSFPSEHAWDKSEFAGGLGVRRITEDPWGYLELQPRKFVILWGDESYAAGYALTAGSAVTRDLRVAWLLSQLFYAPILVLSLIGMISERRRPGRGVLLIGMIVSLVAATHLFLEVHSRYHAYLVPLFCLLAAAGVEALVRWWHERRPTPATS